MGKVIVGRPIDGITVNEDMEFLLDDEGNMLYFGGIDQAREYLEAHGVTDQEIEHMAFVKSCGTCRRCGAPLFLSSIPEYKYQCFECDEDFYGFEQE